MEQITCPHCGETFKKLRTNQVYCSVKCRKNADHKRNPAYKLVCSDCGATFKTNNKNAKTPRCPACREKWHAECDAEKAAKAAAKNERASAFEGHEWRELEDYPGFLVNEEGRVWSSKPKKMLAIKYCHGTPGVQFGPKSNRRQVSLETMQAAYKLGSLSAALEATKAARYQKAVAGAKPYHDAKWDATHEKVLAAWNSGLNAKQIREALGLGENTVMRHLHKAGIYPQKLVEERAAEKRATAEAERLSRETFRDMKGEQIELFPKTCQACGRPISVYDTQRRYCEECSQHRFTYDHSSCKCEDCGRTFSASRYGPHPKRCPECQAAFTKRRNRDNRKVHKYPGDIAGGFNARARKACRKYGGEYRPQNRRAILERDGWTCYICGTPLRRGPFDNQADDATVDHVIPLAKGGDHMPNNLKACCFACNSKKSASAIEEVASCAQSCIECA